MSKKYTIFDFLLNTIFRYKAPGGSIILEGEKPQTSICVFEANEDTETLKSYVQVRIFIVKKETCIQYIRQKRNN